MDNVHASQLSHAVNSQLAVLMSTHGAGADAKAWVDSDSLTAGRQTQGNAPPRLAVGRNS